MALGLIAVLERACVFLWCLLDFICFVKLLSLAILFLFLAFDVFGDFDPCLGCLLVQEKVESRVKFLSGKGSVDVLLACLVRLYDFICGQVLQDDLIAGLIHFLAAVAMASYELLIEVGFWDLELQTKACFELDLFCVRIRHHFGFPKIEKLLIDWLLLVRREIPAHNSCQHICLATKIL